jgi:hypothetical protein
MLACTVSYRSGRDSKVSIALLVAIIVLVYDDIGTSCLKLLTCFVRYWSCILYPIFNNRKTEERQSYFMEVSDK